MQSRVVPIFASGESLGTLAAPCNGVPLKETTDRRDRRARRGFERISGEHF